jgi:hypothetical protein
MDILHQFTDQVRNRLLSKGYSELAPIVPLQAAFVKPSVFGTSVIAITDARSTTDTPAVRFQRVQTWLNKLVGNGRGLLLFVYSYPLATTVEEIEKAHFYTDSAAIDAGLYDLATGKHWLSYSQFEQDVFG